MRKRGLSKVQILQKPDENLEIFYLVSQLLQFSPIKHTFTMVLDCYRLLLMGIYQLPLLYGPDSTKWSDFFLFAFFG